MYDSDENVIEVPKEYKSIKNRRGGIRREFVDQEAELSGTNCIKIGLRGKLILSKRKGLWEVIFSRK